ncbi:tripartite tricarboxylate transporter substrate binding protein [Pigmentiphaga sp.]|uniref:Bug family tripartite tricarboxylate transporter substrate binding protein n=1 Tax=Pigmentiphaga sp. TaxID=1977564 RepID=UPI00128D6A42|nr:tripartite tricarboxylate transporter substrate binding protein [Pigmentiphaga sp.]MPS26258.1 tripartite tricarboxylate transporter substrate binding protein [Alcaligenaceae bacterium SAGV5]MPS53234.1 tripartite tricarboxylate transporter substrate binding protein [Alcaligenaceae bacterium SAGV3]MPT57712.1 tripartite tricarboxylate transporter substrate binding protein [Alcaligenaceae bacterium]
MACIEKKSSNGSRTSILFLASALTPFVPAGAWAQGTAEAGYPTRPLTFVVAQTAGGLVDTFTRSMARHLSARLGRQIVVENKPGASQAIGAEAVAKAAPDGYTFFVGAQSAMVLNVVSKKSVPYDPVADFSPVGLLFRTPFYLVVNNSVPARTVGELIALAKAKPGKLTYASTGHGSGHHFTAEMFKVSTGTNILHVPYKGSAPAITDLRGGQVDMMFEGGASALPMAKAGNLRVLGATSAKRTEAMPELPTLNETIPGFGVSIWVGLFAPAGTPRPIIDRINLEVADFLRQPATHEQGKAFGIEITPSTPEEVSAILKEELPAWARVVREAGIQQE